MATPQSLTSDTRVAVIGLGYIGLPLAVSLGNHRPVLGFDIDADRIDELQRGRDNTREVEPAELTAAHHLTFSAEPTDLAACRIFLVSVPTPVTPAKTPDFGPLLAATRLIASHLTYGDIVVYESTVYPGATEEICVPELERASGMRLNEDFFIGYSPERANPGDREHRLSTITKVVAGSTPEVADLLAELYGEVVLAGIHRAPSIRVAEAAKVIENVQRDINVALVNELATIFNRLDIDTQQVLEAAGTKWNFLPFRPGLVGGHCIGVDPYYLTHKAQAIGHHPEMILAGRRINDGMGRHISNEVVRLMLRNRIQVCGSRVLVLGFSFKENCPDIRNTRVIDIVNELTAIEVDVDVHDPWADPAEIQYEYGFSPEPDPASGQYDAVILAVAHRDFIELGADRLRGYCREGGVLYDVKYALPADKVDGRL